MTSSLSNPDLAPVPADHRTWSRWNIAALWIGMSVCIPTYTIAASMINNGMSWWQALLTVMLGNLVVLVPMILNGHGGTKYGVPFPVLARASFGTVGAHIPSIARALVACGWFGIQCWIGGSAIYQIAGALDWLDPAADAANKIGWLGITPLQFLCFMIFWAINLALVLKGIESIRWLESLAAPFLLLAGFALFIWAVLKVDSPKALFTGSTFEKPGDFWRVFFPQLTAMVGFWATLSLNIPDFTRYCKTQRDQAYGQLLGLPTTMTLFCFIGITVTGATVAIFGHAIWNPVELIPKLGSPTVVILSLFALAVATISTNLAANVVSPANGFSNVAPSKISFRTGAILTCILGVLIMPWRLWEDLGAYILTWLIGYSSLLGPIAGVMIADYFVLRRTRLASDELYEEAGRYAGVNWRAVIALVIGVLPNLPGFINAATRRTHAAFEQATAALQAARDSGMSQDAIDAAIKAGDLTAPMAPFAPQFFDSIYQYAWFVGLPLAAIVYIVIMGERAAPAERASVDSAGEGDQSS